MDWEGDVATADGGTVHLRPITPEDADRLVAFHARQSPESIYFRFFSARPRLSEAEVERFTTVDHVDREAFVALLQGEIVGVARYDRLRSAGITGEAEVAFFIDDQHHGRGLATILLEHLAAVARANGIARFVAHVLPANRPMLGVFKQAGFEVRTRFADGVVEVSFDVAETDASLAAAEARASRSEVRTVARLLEPRSVAVVGAGRRAGTVGHEVLRQLLTHEFCGPVFPVNREAGASGRHGDHGLGDQGAVADARHFAVASVPAWASVLEVPGPVDLAVIAVPAPDVQRALDECVQARVGAVVVVTAGFTADEEAAMVATVRRHGIRLLGPASLGLVNTAGAVQLHATFAPMHPRPGRVALSLQSGTLGDAIVARATELGLGFSAVVGIGDKADLSSNDLLAWWEADDRTDVVVLSLESFGNPRRFRELAPRVGRRKPIVALVRRGMADADLLLQQTGVVAVESLAELLDVSRLLAWQPVPAGRRVHVVADGDGVAAFTASACEAAGLTTTRAVLPLGAGPSEYEAAVARALADGDVDAVLAVYTAPIGAKPADVARALAAAQTAAPATPLVASFPSADMPGRIAVDGGRGIPNYDFPDAAARALGRAAGHGAWRSRPPGVLPDLPGLDLDAARALVLAALDEGTGVGAGRLVGPERLAAALGITVAPQVVVRSAGEAVAAAAAMGGAVALKAAGRAPSAKTEAAGVALDLPSPDAVAGAYERMVAVLGDAMAEAVVQPMVAPGIDAHVTLAPAPIVGASLGLGVGGALPGLVVPVARAVPPLTDVTAADLIERSGLGAVLDAAGREALADVVQRVAVLADEVPEVVAVDLNPVIVGPAGAAVTDLTVEIAPYIPGLPASLRRL